MMDAIKKKLESTDIEEQLERLNHLLAQEEKPNAQALGMILALMMTKEMKDGKALGSESGLKTVKWKEQYGDSTVEEAIVFARQFLTKPADLVEKIGHKLFNS